MKAQQSRWRAHLWPGQQGWGRKCLLMCQGCSVLGVV